MKIKSINILSLIMIGFVILLGSCEEKDDYNFDGIDPIIFSITGPGTVAAHGLTDFPYRYHVPHRGGSTFNWSVTTLLGASATIVLDDEYPSIAYITFDQSSVEDVATISVTETTMGGKTSPVLTTDVTLTPFCPEDMEPWAGTWVSDNGLDHDELEVTVPPQTLNTLVIDGLLGWLVEISWAETWDPTQGGVGKTRIEFDCGNVIIVPEQLLGTTFEWGPYWISGEGTYDPEEMTMTIVYNIAWSQGGDVWNTFESNLEMGGTKSARINMEIPAR